LIYPTINYITGKALKAYENVYNLRFCLVLLLLFVITFSPAQNPIQPAFVPHSDSLRTSLIQSYRAEALAELEQYNYKTKAKWLNFIPSPGITLGAPTINYNLSNVAQAINGKHIKAATQDAILLRWQVQLNSAWSEIVLLRETLLNRIEAYNASLDLVQLHQAKFEIIEKGYSKSEVTPSEYLTGKLALASIFNELRKEFSALVSLRNELLIKAKKGNTISLFDGLLQSSFKNQSTKLQIK